MVRAMSGPLKIGHKEPAGHLFHTAVLKQSGLFGAWWAAAGLLMMVLLLHS